MSLVYWGLVVVERQVLGPGRPSDLITLSLSRHFNHHGDCAKRMGIVFWLL